ncbi:EAL domain-containing protein [Pseudomonas fulva]|uniref:EAL domain-containing protein n=1 Tax=Pseudomonas fulva TaxID=47880 RepID=UPI002185B859|nr:EAL domain-containing protein [Pseudomonas fulva]
MFAARPLPDLDAICAATVSSDEARVRYVYEQLQRGRFHLAFQPVRAAADTARTLYQEGLLRSDGEPLGFNPFAVLERRHSMRRLDRCVVEAIISLLARHPTLTLGCNVSAQSATLDYHWEQVLQRLADSGIASRLVIEITESSAPISHDQAVEFVHQLRSTGCHVAIDDFGSGFGTLAFIQQAQPDIIKIDQGYVQRARRSSLHAKTLRHLVGLCNTLAAHVVVEGIETADDLAISRECEAQWVQGFLFARAQKLLDGLDRPCVLQAD